VLAGADLNPRTGGLMLVLIYMYFICLLQLPRSNICYFCLFPNLQINTSIVVRPYSQRPPVPEDSRESPINKS
jgi:hypothetical protein